MIVIRVEAKVRLKVSMRHEPTCTESAKYAESKGRGGVRLADRQGVVARQTGMSAPRGTIRREHDIREIDLDQFGGLWVMGIVQQDTESHHYLHPLQYVFDEHDLDVLDFPDQYGRPRHPETGALCEHECHYCNAPIDPEHDQCLSIDSMHHVCPNCIETHQRSEHYQLMTAETEATALRAQRLASKVLDDDDHWLMNGNSAPRA